MIKYLRTNMEDWVSIFYKRMGIISPSEMSLEAIADYCDVTLLYEEVSSYYLNTPFGPVIVLDTRLNAEKQRETFFHELCHIIRHGGMQGVMPDMLRDLQEWDAVNFTRCAAIPFHMLHYIRLDQGRDIVAEMVEMFQVTPELCAERLKQIQKRSKGWSA